MWYQEKGWKSKKKQEQKTADLGEVTEKIWIEEEAKSNKKSFFLYVRFSNTIQHWFGVTTQHDMEAIVKKCWIFIINIHIKEMRE